MTERPMTRDERKMFKRKWRFVLDEKQALTAINSILETIIEVDQLRKRQKDLTKQVQEINRQRREEFK
jgi:hypothetical protein